MMHPDTSERRRSLNIERFATARGWTETNVSAFDIESAPVKLRLFPLITRTILALVSLAAIGFGILIPVFSGTVPGWRNQLSTATVIAVCILLQALTERLARR